MSLVYDHDYLVGGYGMAKVTPDFRVVEFMWRGQVRVHRELVGALQELRDAVGSAVVVKGLQPRDKRGVGKRGCFAFVAADRPAALLWLQAFF